MSAAEKNRQALASIFGNDALAGRLSETRLAVVTPQGELPIAGRILVEFLTDTLARLWTNIDFSGGSASELVGLASQAALSGENRACNFREVWEPAYDCVICVCCKPPPSESYSITVGADGWTAEIGSSAHCGSDANPVGPALAAALASAQAFSKVFSSELAPHNVAPLSEIKLDARDICGMPELGVSPFKLPATHVFGAGAVTHGLVAVLCRWPQPITGTMTLVDPDDFGVSNGQRYAFMSPGHIGKSKVDVLAGRIQHHHPGLKTGGRPLGLNEYCAEIGYAHRLDLIVTGLDSPEARRQAALKLPRQAINMWTDSLRAGAGVFVPDRTNACLACAYPEDLSGTLDEVALICSQTGLPPRTVRDLLDSARTLSDQEAKLVAGNWGINYLGLVGQPIRSVLPIGCAIGKFSIEGSKEPVEVPLAFSSLFAGIAGFMMLLAASFGESKSTGWSQHIFKSPNGHMRRTLPRRKGCVCCEEFLAALEDGFFLD